MSDYAREFGITVPAGNGVQTFQTSLTKIGLAEVRRVLVTFPPGCAGLVGVQLRLGGSAVYPFNENEYFIHDDYILEQDVTNQVNSGDWSVRTYNFDYIDHVIRLTYQYDTVVYGQSLSSSAPIAL